MRIPRKLKKPKNVPKKFDLTLNLIGNYRQDIILLNLTRGNHPLNFRIEANSGKTLEIAMGCYIVAAIWKETNMGKRNFYRYIKPVMFFLDADLSIDLEQLEEDA